MRDINNENLNEEGMNLSFLQGQTQSFAQNIQGNDEIIHQIKFIFIRLLPIAFIITALASFLLSQTASPATKPTVVLVHGAFADGSGWHEVITLLQNKGYKVVAVQNQLASLVSDIETTKRVIDAQTGSVVVVGHSYGGAVITGAAAGNPNVKALVYIAAFAPEAGEPVGAFLEKFPSDLGTALVPDAAGFLYINTAKYQSVFAADLSRRETDAMAVAQKPIFGAIFGQSTAIAAWKTIPSWYVVAQQDRSINPDLERFYANRINARTTEIRASHVVFISRAKEVTAVIEQAARSAATSTTP